MKKRWRANPLILFEASYVDALKNVEHNDVDGMTHKGQIRFWHCFHSSSFSLYEKTIVYQKVIKDKIQRCGKQNKRKLHVKLVFRSTPTALYADS